MGRIGSTTLQVYNLRDGHKCPVILQGEVDFII